MKLLKKRLEEPASKLTAKMNRERLAPAERPELLVEIEKQATVVRSNLERLREQRLEKEARERLREISKKGKQPRKARPRKGIIRI